MDGTAAINENREALKRILTGLVAMAGLAGAATFTSPLCGLRGRSSDRASGSIVGLEGRGDCEAIGAPGNMGEASGGGCDAEETPTRRSDDRRPPHKGEVKPGFTLPRHLHRAILRLLRPAEAATRRLIIAAARGLVVVLPPAPRPSQKSSTTEPLLRRFGIAVVISAADLARAARILPRSRGRGTGEAGGGGGPRPMRLPLFDPPRRVRLSAGSNRHVAAHAAPRILFPGSTVGLHPEVRAGGEPRRTLSPDDPIDATRLTLRLTALAAALEDLPGQAKRFARWRARAVVRQAGEAPAPGRIRRIAPLRPGRPPGGRLSRFDPSARRSNNIREVDEVLAHAHALALYALRYPDTS
jgi:hypothetical protein